MFKFGKSETLAAPLALPAPSLNTLSGSGVFIPPTMTLTPTQIDKLDQLEKTIHAGKQTFVEVGLALMTIRDERLYERDYSTFEGYCQGRWGWGVRRAQQLTKAAAFWKERQLIVDTTGEAPPLPKIEKAVKLAISQDKTDAKKISHHKTEPESTKQHLSAMPARIEPQAEVTFVSPPSILQRPLTHFEVVHRLEAVERDLKSLLDSTALAASSKFRHALHEVQVVRASIQMELPGMALAESPRAKSRGTLGEVQNFALSLSLPESDGTSCFWKWESNGWKNGGEPIKDWKSTMRHWQAAGYMPSQRTNGQPKPETLADQSRRKIRQIVNEGLREVTP